MPVDVLVTTLEIVPDALTIPATITTTGTTPTNTMQGPTDPAMALLTMPIM